MKFPLASEAGLYSPPAEVERLKQMLEMKLKEKVQKWRTHMKTIWNRYVCGPKHNMRQRLTLPSFQRKSYLVIVNLKLNDDFRYCSSLLKESLSHWEYWTFNPSAHKPVLSQRLKQLMVSYKVTIFISPGLLGLMSVILEFLQKLKINFQNCYEIHKNTSLMCACMYL